MSLDHAVEPSSEAVPYLDALSDLCDHYGVAPESKYAELGDEARSASETQTGRGRTGRGKVGRGNTGRGKAERKAREGKTGRTQAERSDSRPGPVKRVHYLTAGEGPPLLLLHGLSSTVASWVPLLDSLTDHFTVYAPDRPGRGLSSAVDYRETGFRAFGVEYVMDFLDAVGVEETAILGNSLGGFQSLASSIDHPDRVTRQCLVGAPAGLSRSIPVLFRLFDAPVAGRWLFDYFKADTVAEARTQFRRINVEDDSTIPDAYFRPGMVGEDLPGQRESLWSLLDTLGTARGMRPQFDLRDALPSIEAPTRFVWGTEDYFWPPDVGRRWHDVIPDADLVVLDDHGHMPWLEPGDEATEAAVAFLAGEAGPEPES